MSKIVYTYYEPIAGLQNQYEILEICKQSWVKYGWDFRIISEQQAKQHYRYEEYKKTISQLSSVNPNHYDYHCYMRWLSMVVVGGGIMIDYDVINTGLSDSSLFHSQDLTVYQGHVPCVVSGYSDQYLNIVEHFCLLASDPSVFIIINERHHTSDMIMLSSNKIPFRTLNIVEDYPYNKSRLIHCSETSCKNLGISKIDAIKTIVCRK